MGSQIGPKYRQNEEEPDDEHPGKIEPIADQKPAQVPLKLPVPRPANDR
jgi:hypothetical protein